MIVDKKILLHISSFFIFLGFYVTIFSFQDGVGLYYQLMSVFFIVIAGFFCYLINGRVGQFSFFELVVFFSIISSFCTSLVYGNLYSFQYTVIFLVFCLSSVFIVRVHSIESLTKIYGFSASLILITVFFLEFSHWQDSINVSVTTSGLIRFTPLGMHPNLTGIAYSGTAIVLFFLMINTSGILLKFFYFSLSLLSVSFALAASARGSLLMLFIAFIFWLSRLIRVGGIKNLSIIILIAFSLLVFLVSNFTIIYDYLVGMLEIESDYRGIDTGGTGRTELWAMGIEGLIRDPIRLIFGAGFRSAEEDDIGFSLESSYLVLIYEVGILIAAAILVAIYSSVSVVFSKHKSTSLGVTGYRSMTFYIAIFFILQSFFNRYLISIGSFYTVFFLLIVFEASVMSRLKFNI